jgi:hypothetical protein
LYHGHQEYRAAQCPTAPALCTLAEHPAHFLSQHTGGSRLSVAEMAANNDKTLLNTARFFAAVIARQ